MYQILSRSSLNKMKQNVPIKEPMPITEAIQTMKSLNTNTHLYHWLIPV
jgi:hypothetical protein